MFTKYYLSYPFAVHFFCDLRLTGDRVSDSVWGGEKWAGLEGGCLTLNFVITYVLYFFKAVTLKGTKYTSLCID